ncbi:MAG: ribosomal protein S18-alanine N-acetyltransferase [Gammaproteobacteria bacterium]
MIESVKDYFFNYDADREFYSKVFPGSVSDESLIRIRKMRLNDLGDVMAIEEKVYKYPWSRGIFNDCLVARYDCFVCEDKEKIISYAILAVAVDEAHVLNLCVDPSVQGRGYGHMMLEHLISVARNKFADFVMLEVRPSNSVAISLYKKWGFNEIGVRKNYYPSEKGKEDAIMLALPLQPYQTESSS